MKNMMKSFWKEESGMGTVEIILIVAVLVAIATLFGQSITAWVKEQLEKIFGN